MLYRFVAVTIVVFWAVMTTLLIRNEVNPGSSSLREVPVQRVFKQLFVQEQRSNLRVYSGATPIGHVFIYPHVDSETEARVLELTGSLTFDGGQGYKQRVSWDSVLRMNTAYEVKQSHYRIKMHEPEDLLAEIESDVDEPLVRVRFTSKRLGSVEREIPLNRTAIEGMAQQFGVSGEMMGMLHQSAAKSKLIIRARQSSLRLGRDLRAETYLVTVDYDGQTYLECHFSLLGQALRATTIFGYTLRDELLP